MEELISTANVYYESCPLAVKEAAGKFFKDIDHNKDGKVSLHEFLEFMKQEGHAKMSSRDFFKTLDRKGTGTLGFKEVLALFYIIQSGRPFCCGCDVFIAGMYFTCSKCYQSDKNTVIFLCPRCFRKGLYTHRHERNQFLDNYALLALERKQRIAWARTHSTQQHQVQLTSSKAAASPSNPTKAIVCHQSTHRSHEEPRKSPGDAPSKSTALVPYVPPHNGREHKWKPALEALKQIAFIASCTAYHCTIM